MNKTFTYSILFFLGFATITSCKKDKSVFYPDNNAPYYDGIPKVKVQNYINRIFIDLIGREPLDAEMTAEENALRAADFSMEAREALITKLQTSTVYIPGDSSYKYAYYNRFHELCKARVCEAASDDDFAFYAGLAQYQVDNDSLAGDSIAVMMGREIIKRNLDVIACQEQYREGEIEVKDIFYRMTYNSVYDQIICAGYRSNSFNILNFTFDQLFFRFPTTNEFDAGYEMLEFEKPSILFGKSGQNRGDYTNILVNSDEFYEGVIRWTYGYLLQREPTTVEVNKHMQTFFNDHNMQKLQLSIMKTDEYANF